jgi:hypothetical protein
LNTDRGEYSRFNLESLIRADAVAKAESITKLVAGGVIDRNNIESFFEYYNIECTKENKNKFFDNTDFINDIDDDVNLLMHELLKQAGFDVDNYE